MNMHENHNNHLSIVVELYLLFVVIILSFTVILNLFGNLVAKEILNIIRSLNVE